VIPPEVSEPALFVASESVVAEVSEPVVLFVALVSEVSEPEVDVVAVVVVEPEVVFVVDLEVSEPVLFVASVSEVSEPVLFFASESVPDVAEPQASVDIAVVFVVLIPVSEVAVEVGSPGRPRFFAFPNACSFPNCSNSVGGVDGESVHNSTGVRTNYGLYSILSNPGLHQNKNLEQCYNNPTPGYNNVSDTNALPRNATTNHPRNTYLHLYREQRRHTSQVALSLVVVWQIR
jgi:hypothetical protein